MSQTYVYRARTRSGREVQGTIISPDAQQAADRLREEGYLITSMRSRRVHLDLSRWFTSPPGARDLGLFCNQMATMLRAGLSLVNVLGVLESQTTNRLLREAAGAMREEVTEGTGITEAFNQHSRVFPPVLVHMVEAGETGGILDSVLDRMAQHFDKEYSLRQKVQGAMTYPAIVALVAIVAVVFLVSFVVPTFAVMFEDAGVPLPWPTRVLLGISGFMGSNWYWFVPLLSAAGMGALSLLRRPRGRRFRDRFLFRMPLFGPLLQKVATARFCRTLGMLLDSGIGVITALTVVKNTAGNVVITEAVDQVQEGVQKGEGLSQLLNDTGVFPPMVVQMVGGGEESGNLDQMLSRVADYFEQEVDHSVSRLSTLVEPVLIFIVAFIVGFIVISIVLPMFDLTTVIV